MIKFDDYVTGSVPYYENNAPTFTGEEVTKKNEYKNKAAPGCFAKNQQVTHTVKCHFYHASLVFIFDTIY